MKWYLHWLVDYKKKLCIDDYEHRLCTRFFFFCVHWWPRDKNFVFSAKQKDFTIAVDKQHVNDSRSLRKMLFGSVAESHVSYNGVSVFTFWLETIEQILWDGNWFAFLFSWFDQRTLLDLLLIKNDIISILIDIISNLIHPHIKKKKFSIKYQVSRNIVFAMQEK